jgi:hypothetical protein
MFSLGILSIIQVGFLPGFLILRTLRLTDGFLRTLLLAFALSLVVNHAIILVLITLHIYTSPAVYILFVSEAAVLIWMMRSASSRPVLELLKDDYRRFRDLFNSITNKGHWSATIQATVFIAAILALILYGDWAWMTVGQIFHENDEVVSWNRWAVDWANGRFPSQTWHYPQLLPSIFSLVYVFIGDSSVQFFAKAIMPLFPIAILLALFDLGLRTQQIGYFIAICLLRFLMPFVAEDVTAGYADTPVAYMAFMPIYLLLQMCDSAQVQNKKSDLILGAVLCAGSALTKQAGLYIAAVYPVLCYVLVLRNAPGMITRDKLKLMTVISTIMLILITPWYLYTQIRIIKGLEASELPFLADRIHGATTFAEPFSRAVNNTLIETLHQHNGQVDLSAQSAMLLGIIILVGMVVGLFYLSWRYLFVLVIAPFFLIWVFYFSYDMRNLSLVVPLIGGASGFGLGLGGEVLYMQLRKLRSLGPGMITVATAVVLLTLNIHYDAATLREGQVTLQKQIGDPFINDLLYRYQAAEGFKGKIITNYQMVGYLPGLEKLNRFDFMTSLPTLQMNIQDPETRYLLLISRPPTEVMSYLGEGMITGRFRVITYDLVSNPIVLFLEINRDLQ